MTAFLFIPSTTGAGPGRRVNFADIANLFAEVEQPPPRPAGASAIRIALLILLLLGVIGDMLLVTRTDTLASWLAASRTAPPAVTAARSWLGLDAT